MKTKEPGVIFLLDVFKSYLGTWRILIFSRLQ